MPSYRRLQLQIKRNPLVVELCQHTIPKARLCVIRVAWFIRFAVMYVVGYDIDLFGYRFYNEILRDDTPYRMAKTEGLVRTEPVKPDRSMQVPMITIL